MKIAMINLGNFGSTGNIMLDLSEQCKINGMESVVCYPDSLVNRKKKICNSILIGKRIGKNIHRILGRLTGLHGLFSIVDTLLFIKKLDEFKPDIIHLHNLHNFYINFPILFKYINKNDIAVVWTLHDCWAFTGHCPYFTLVGCDKWMNGCGHCPQYREYPMTYVDQSKWLWRLKKKLFTNVKNMILVTPSYWLAGLVKESFLKKYSVKVIPNGIDLAVFKPYADVSIKDVLKSSDNDKKYIVLGVAAYWGRRKGLDVFVNLSHLLDEKYQIIMVGTNDNVDAHLPPGIISIHHTQNREELAKLYSVADVFVNPTREDNYPTVNLEAIACGTPVITFDSGGSPECIYKGCGTVIKGENIEQLAYEIMKICEDGKIYSNACLQQREKFDKQLNYKSYINIYRDIMKQ